MPTYRYPLDVGQTPFDKFIKFDAKRMRHFLRTPMRDDTVASAVIYLPETALKNTIGVTWEPVGLGAGLATGVLQSASGRGFDVVTSMDTAKNQLSSMAGALWDDAKEAGFVGTLTNAFKNVGAEVAGAAVPDRWRQIASAVTGVNINPRTEILFDTAQYRTYQFEFTMVPRNFREAVQIDSIVKFFQFYMLPQFYDNDLIIGYPYEFEIGVFNNFTPEGQIASTKQIKRVSHIGRSIIKGCTVDAAAGGKVAFVRDDGAEEKLFPVATTLSLETQEVKLLSREDPEILRGSSTQPGEADVPYFPNPR